MCVQITMHRGLFHGKNGCCFGIGMLKPIYEWLCICFRVVPLASRSKRRANVHGPWYTYFCFIFCWYLCKNPGSITFNIVNQTGSLLSVPPLSCRYVLFHLSFYIFRNWYLLKLVSRHFCSYLVNVILIFTNKKNIHTYATVAYI